MLDGDYFPAEAAYELAHQAAAIGAAAVAGTLVSYDARTFRELVHPPIRQLLEGEYGIGAPELWP